MDIKLNQNKGYWDLDIENGDLAKTDSLDTAVFMSVFCEKRSNLVEPTLARGHFTNDFYNGYQVGSLLWFYTEQAKNTNSNLFQIETAVNEGLKWLVDDNIITNTKTKATKKNSEVNIEVELNGKSQSKYYNLFLNL
jgi:phage gp46-like protein